MKGYEPLRRALGADRVRGGEILAPYTTFKIGGPADLFYEPRTADELATAILAAREHGVPHFLLGLGANILIGDRGFRGLVIRNLARDLRFSLEERTVRAESGAVVWPDLIEAAIAHGLSGLEHYVGIPSTVGGALWQNLHFLSPAPARERTMFIAEVTRGAEILTAEGERREVDVSWFEFGYDTSVLHHRPDVVLAATFQLEPASPERMPILLPPRPNQRLSRRHSREIQQRPGPQPAARAPAPRSGDLAADARQLSAVRLIEAAFRVSRGGPGRGGASAAPVVHASAVTRLLSLSLPPRRLRWRIRPDERRGGSRAVA